MNNVKALSTWEISQTIEKKTFFFFLQSNWQTTNCAYLNLVSFDICVQLWIHYYNQNDEHYCHGKNKTKTQKNFDKLHLLFYPSFSNSYFQRVRSILTHFLKFCRGNDTFYTVFIHFILFSIVIFLFT